VDIEANRYINVEYNDWYDYVFESWIEKLKTRGYEDINIQFSGFCSQGDGACFTAYVDIPTWVKHHRPDILLKLDLTEPVLAEIFRTNLDIISSKIKKTSHGYLYTHENTVSYILEYNDKYKMKVKENKQTI